MTTTPMISLVSMWEIEDLIEESVMSLATRREAPADRRSYYRGLFAVQEQFDTKFTHFRVMDQLLAARYVYRVPVAEHPEYATDPAYFDALGEPADMWVTRPVDEGGYVDAGHLFFDAGSELWQRMVDLGRLTGPDAEPPVPIGVARLAADMCDVARAAGSAPLVSKWYRLAGVLLMCGPDPDPARLAGDTDVRRLRDYRAAALALTPPGPAFADIDPAADADLIAEYPGLTWWFDLDGRE